MITAHIEGSDTPLPDGGFQNLGDAFHWVLENRMAGQVAIVSGHDKLWALDADKEFYPPGLNKRQLESRNSIWRQIK